MRPIHFIAVHRLNLLNDEFYFISSDSTQNCCTQIIFVPDDKFQAGRAVNILLFMVI